jgi:hypothetical protein
MNDKEIKTHLESITRRDWDRLFDLLPEIEETKDFGEPYIRTAPIVHKFGELVYNLDLVVKFSWDKWPKGTQAVENETINFNRYSATSLVKMIAYIMRMDHFDNGALIHYFNRGVMQKILLALRRKISGGYDGREWASAPVKQV